ncbi:hypothetical protein R3P38DRAFT_3182959 [Favolaschia claudopus]|uniref:Uncharacterized protein n=1 Tax=Favolaschia claudopus TaxID=2862362 RepID=A0AAW0CG21_9AGAR
MACVDPHLVSAVDIIIDVDDAALGMSEKAQRSFLRRLLVVGRYSMYSESAAALIDPVLGQG